ncbi:MAG: phosphoglycerate mutase family protein, partial [Steroidobacteraceae bacterium]
PLWVTLLAGLVAIGVVFAGYRAATTTVVVLVPSGEKEPGTIEDPPISTEGEQRAQRLAQMFGGGGGHLDAIYVSREHRAQQAAAPLVDLLHLTPVVYNSGDASGTAAAVLRAHGGGAVLVIGSIAALQQFLKELGGAQATPPAPDDPDLLYIVSVPSVGRAHVLRLKY